MHNPDTDPAMTDEPKYPNVPLYISYPGNIEPQLQLGHALTRVLAAFGDGPNGLTGSQCTEALAYARTWVLDQETKTGPSPWAVTPDGLTGFTVMYDQPTGNDTPDGHTGD